MNIREKNRHEMLGRIWNFGEEEKDSFTEVPTISTIFNDIKLIHKEIGLNANVLQEGTKGKVISKDVSQAEIVTIGLSFAGAIYGYAADKNDTELMVFSDINSKTFGKQRDSEVPVLVENILDKTDQLGDALAAYGITAEKKANARAKLDDYLAKFANLNTGKGTKKSARENINLLFNKADKKLKMLDKLMLNFIDNAELYTKYQAARVIYDKAGSHKTVEPQPEQTEEKK